QHFLARLYTDADLRARFLAQPYEEARAAGFDEERARELAKIEPKGLELAAESYSRKRNLRGKQP
ncbi:MAG TPA: hypothetical protein VEO74_00405, partial [Thermoanaerobaculia bacterium]|nr:hypothetical protein [Thermoanaerobaculia bacterium]